MQNELDNFFQVIFNKRVPFHKVSDSAFCQARAKLKSSAFVELNKIQVDYFYDHFETSTWLGFRLLAIDGSTVELPSSPEIRKYFGVHTVNDQKKEMSLGRFSQCFDLLNHMTIDAEIGLYKGKNSGEQEHAIKHIDRMKKGDLVLMDRNYPCFYLFSLLLSKNIDYCCRLKISSWKLSKQLLSTNETELFGEILPSKAAMKKCEQLGISTKPIRVRLIKVLLKTGEEEILISSLLNNTKYNTSLFSDLYFQRWGIEEFYKEFKHKLEVENFSGKSVLSVFQDVYAKVFTANITNILATDAMMKLKKKKRKYVYKINRTNAYNKMKNLIVLLFDEQIRCEILTSILDLFVIKPIPIRINRVYDRNFGHHSRRYHMTYKTC